MLGKVKSVLVFFGSFAVAGISTASAGTITHLTDRTTFEGLFTSEITEDFGNTSHFPINSGVLNSATNEAGIQPGDIVDGVTFSTEIGTGNFFNIDRPFGSNGTPFLDSVVGNNNLTVTFDSAQSGFGFDTWAPFMSAFDLTINFSGGGSFSNSFNPGTGFAGFVSDSTDIVSLVIDGTSGSFPFALDNFTFSGETIVAPVPLPAALPLLAGGLGFFGLMGWRRKRKAAIA